MQFIDKENHVTVFFDVLDDIVHPFFKVPTEARPCNDIHEIQFKNTHLRDFSWNIATSDTLGQA